jgi:hypothetical protein
MDLFIDASTQLQEAAKTLIDTHARFLDVVNRVNELESLIFTTENVSEVKLRVDQLEANLQNSSLALAESSTLLDLISKNNDNINAIINGTIPVNLQYNTDVLKAGPGIEIDKSVPNKVKIVNKNQGYKLNVLFEEDSYATIINQINPLDLNQSFPKAYFKLDEFTNMIRFNTVNAANGNLKIFIDDTTFKFKQGQIIRFVWDSSLNIGNKNILIYTDKLNKFGLGILNKSIATIASTDIISNKPIIEIICLDEINYTFAVDILR